jgi:hypothetical protein
MARSRSRIRSAALVALMAFAGAAHASDEPRETSFGRILIERANALLAEASAARIPPRRPPTPVPVRWKAKRLGAVDLGAPLVALAAGDLDRDGRAELAAVTEREVLVLAPRGKRALAVVARASLPEEPPEAEPRLTVATAVVVDAAAGAELWVRASNGARGARYTYARGKLKRGADLDRYPLCEDRSGELARGRDYFERTAGDALPITWPSRYWAAACKSGLVDREGRALRVDAVLGARGVLGVTVRVKCDDGEGACTPERVAQIGGVGVAFAIADVDRDGKPEVITSAASAPGDADAVTVHSLPQSGGKVGKPVFSKTFSGGVGGIAADDLDGDGDVEVIAAVRLAGAKRVDLWLLD